jgi:hypothetical protein
MTNRTAVQVTAARVETLLGSNPAFTQVEDHFYVVRQGTAYVYVQVAEWAPDRAVVRLVAQLVKGVEITPDLALKLLRLNARMRFGAFGYVRDGACIVFSHTLLGGETLDEAELLTALRQLAIVADEYDDHIVEEAGGKRMQDLLDESVSHALGADMDGGDSWDE